MSDFVPDFVKLEEGTDRRRDSDSDRHVSTTGTSTTGRDSLPFGLTFRLGPNRLGPVRETYKGNPFFVLL